MNKPNIQEEIENLTQKFKLRAKKSCSDEKRHDRIHKDEARAMLKAEEKFGLTPMKIGEVFRRDVRAVSRTLSAARAELPEEQEPREKVAKRARLQLEFDPKRPAELGLIYYSHSPLVRKFARVSVMNLGEATAVRSFGVLTILSPKEAVDRYPRSLKLHWVDAPYDLETDSAQPIDIQVGDLRLLDVAFSQPRKDDLRKLNEPAFGLALTSGRPYSVTVGSAGPAEWELPIPKEGCWVANGLALANPCSTAPGYMPPGRYVVELMVGCEEGQGDTQCFEIVSPLEWQDLQMISVKSLLHKPPV